jgi:hypothetical protein
MNDEANIDARSVELKDSKGDFKEFTPMPMANAPAPEPEKEYTANVESLRQAGRDLQGGREVELPIVKRGYIQAAGVHRNERMPIHFTRTAKESAADLAEMRRAEAGAEQEQALTSFQQEVDADRAAQQPQQAQQPDLQPQPTESQPQAQQQTNGLHPDVAAALSNEHVRNAIQAEIQQASVAQQAYSAATMQLQQAAAASLLSSVPELANARTDQEAALVIQTIAKANPQRANEIVGAIQAAQRNMAVVQQHQQAAYAQQQQQFASYCKASDAAFDSFAATRPAAEVKAVRDNIVNVLTEDFGLDPNALAQLYNSNPAFRSVEAQKLIYAAVRNSLAERAMRNTPKGLPPVVQRPGSVGDFAGSADSTALTAATERFRGNPSLKSAAARLTALRAYRQANER